MYVVILYNYEKAVHAHNHRFFWKRMCFNYPFQLYGTKAGFLQANLI